MHRTTVFYAHASIAALCAAAALSAENDHGHKPEPLKITKPPAEPKVKAEKVTPKKPNLPAPKAEAAGDAEFAAGRELPDTVHERRHAEHEEIALAPRVVHEKPKAPEFDPHKPHFLDETGPRGRVITLVLPAPRDEDGKLLPNSSTSTHEDVLPVYAPDAPAPDHKPGHAEYGKDAQSARKRLKERWMVS